MPEIRALIAAAGAGTRAGLPYPKTLHPVLGRPILLRLLDLLQPIDPAPTIVVSPEGRAAIAACIEEQGRAVSLVVQSMPTGMGDAILCFRDSPAFAAAEHLLVVWGDIPLIQQSTLDAMCDAHIQHGNDFTFATRIVDEAYTVVTRDASGGVTALIETREAGLEPGPGERDIGLFIFRTRPLLDLLDQRLPGAVGRRTGEHGFLYAVAHAVAQGLCVEALPIATELDLVSLNQLADLDVLERAEQA
ncbi:MAG TPA: NTP transferase domain-containing protein [Allosphingosinicella sp.]|jgi:bifunctional UDP-N-acetylglucosamine pyrophosphorylase/glucosamine-1-phosphate N-acetyltransferase